MGWFDFSGRIGRGAFLLRFCFCAVAAGALVSFVVNEQPRPDLLGWPAMVAGVLLWILLAAAIGRFRDLGISLWCVFLLFVPVANAFLVFVLVMVEGGWEPEPPRNKKYEIDERFVPPEEYPEQTDESFEWGLTSADFPEGWRWNNGPAWLYKPIPIPQPPEPEPEIDDDLYRKMGLKPPRKRKP